MEKMILVLNSLIPLLKKNGDAHLHDEWQLLSRYLTQNEVRVAVLGPFNQGKSTLLNALLSDNHLPLDIIPTTGAAIYIRHGEELKTKVSLRDGKTVQEKGCELLKRYAVLDKNRRMKTDVASIEMFCPHPILRGEVLLVDLPGTSHSQKEEEFAGKELASADIVIQVLNARQLYTLEEKNKLRDWVFGCGIKHVFFVINFCNLVEPESRQSVLDRAQVVFDGLKDQLSPQSKWYRVDALPALRSQLKFNDAELKESGLIEFTNDLRALIDDISRNKSQHRTSRLNFFAANVLRSLQKQHKIKQTQFSEKERQRKQEDEERKSKTIDFARQFKNLLANLRPKFQKDNLFKKYGETLTSALVEGSFNKWKKDVLQPDTKEKLVAINGLIEEICRFKQEEIFSVSVLFPPKPIYSLPQMPALQLQSNEKVAQNTGAVSGAVVGTAIMPIVGTAIGWFVGKWIGEGVKEIIDDGRITKNAEIIKAHNEQIRTICANVAALYLEKFCTLAFSALEQDEKYSFNFLRFHPLSVTKAESQLRGEISVLKQSITNLEENIKT